mgnify:CR=1 FL=1
MYWRYATPLEWDSSTNESNHEKHDLSFDEAAELIRSGVDDVEIYDKPRSDEEDKAVQVEAVLDQILHTPSCPIAPSPAP